MTAFNRSSTRHAAAFAIVAAHNEADRIAATLAALAEAFPGIPVWVADDGSSDGTAGIAQAAGATVVRSERTIGKGAAVTLAARAALASVGENESVALICDGDLGSSAVRLGPLVEAVSCGDANLAVAVFSRRLGGGFGLAVGFAGWAIRRRCGLVPRAPISGQRALRASTLAQLLPFAPGYGMEIGMTIDAVRAHARVIELDLDLDHRATGRTFGGFVHRGRQLIDFLGVYLTRR
ncbi:MAG TPA: glycosyltransferase [Solirubrobacteraceae bacterium]|jgi:glycosyltransferase involved in cell wall biosynthesis